MPIDREDMSAPVTRGELREELAALEQRLEQKLEQKLEAKFDLKLGLWGGALMEEIKASRRQMLEMERRLMAELGQHTRASNEQTTSGLAAIDDQYKDLPDRVKALEEHVFAKPGPKRTVRRRG